MLCGCSYEKFGQMKCVTNYNNTVIIEKNGLCSVVIVMKCEVGQMREYDLPLFKQEHDTDFAAKGNSPQKMIS